ncbi:hypothetical protein Tco_0033806 [Tanacetum coccineum]
MNCKGVSSLVFQEEVNTAEEVNTGSIKLSTVSEQVSTGSEQVSTVSAKRSTPFLDKDEDWDLIRAKIEANAELSKSMLGSDLQGEDFAEEMVDLVNQEEKYFKLKEFDKCVKRFESFAPINFEATKASLKRFGEELQTKTSKRLKSDEAKDDEPSHEDDSEGSDEVSEQDDSVSGTKILINPVPVAMKSPSIATYKIIKQGEKGGVTKLVREVWNDVCTFNFGAMLMDLSRADLLSYIGL